MYARTEEDDVMSIHFKYHPENGVRGKGRPRVLKTGRTYTPKETKEAEAECLMAFLNSATTPTKAQFVAPLTMDISIQRPLPKSAPKKRNYEADTGKPDIDNIAKLVIDALIGYAYKDDSQIVFLSITKEDRLPYGNDDYVEVSIWYDE